MAVEEKDDEVQGILKSARDKFNAGENFDSISAELCEGSEQVIVRLENGTDVYLNYDHTNDGTHIMKATSNYYDRNEIEARIEYFNYELGSDFTIVY